jgi:uncharacterized protein YggE
MVLALAPLAMARAESRNGGEGHSLSLLTVNGNGELWVEPDEATVRLGVEAQEPDARQAQEQVNRVAGEILRQVRAVGIPAESIQTAELRLTPVYSRSDPRQVESQQPRIIAYQASNVVSVRIEDLDLLGRVLDQGLGAGANRLEGVSFSLRDDLPWRKKALAVAVAEARAKAEAMATALDVRLEGVKEAQEGGVSIVTPRFAETRMMTAQVAAAPTPVASGQIQIAASVTLVYRIAPRSEP